MTGFSAELRAAHADTWRAVVEHPFTDAIGRGDIDPGAMRRYLIQDHRFIDHFVRLLAAAVAAAPTLPDRIPGCQFLALVTGPENTYFERSFEALDVSDADRAGIPDAPVTAAFKALMDRARESGSYVRMLSVLVVAEWSYLDWATRVAAGAADKPFWCTEWIDLHTGDGFESVVAYLRGQLDGAAGGVSDAERAAAAEDFAEAVRLELAFFDMAWGEQAVSGRLAGNG